MDTDLWIYIIVFIGVFILVYVVLLKKERKGNRDSVDHDYIDIQVEEFDHEKLRREAKLGIEIARKAQKEVEDMKRETNKKLEELESKIQSERGKED
jgi:flagellar biosynthesis/type III secretory pathway M-ring protein FliF/YscJ